MLPASSGWVGFYPILQVYASIGVAYTEEELLEAVSGYEGGKTQVTSCFCTQ